MEAIEELHSYKENCLVSLKEKKKRGKKLVGYIPNGYFPVELVYASGAVPVALFKGGEASPVLGSMPYLGRFLAPFCRAQIGYRMGEQEPLYQMVDILIVPVTDQHHRGIADSWNFSTDVEVVELGVPSAKTDQGLEYYRDSVIFLKQRLEDLIGNDITPEQLKQAIVLNNEIRGLLKEISLLRISDRPPIKGKEFVQLMHSSFYADTDVLIDLLGKVKQKLKSQEISSSPGPRILFTGSTLALGDYGVMDLIEASGASIVIEEFFEGIRDYWRVIDTDGDLLSKLVIHYFMNKVPGAFFRGSSKERFDHLKKLIQQFNVDAVLRYSLMYQETYDIEGYLFAQALKDLNIPMLAIKADYEEVETERLRTRIETFVETFKRS